MLNKVKLESLFRNMLQRAFAGELTAKWREGHMKELLVETERQAQVMEMQKRDFQSHNDRTEN